MAIVCPTNAEGSNVVPVTPVPLQVPPVLPVTKEDKLRFPEPVQIVPGLVHAALGLGVTDTVTCAHKLLPQRSSALTK